MGKPIDVSLRAEFPSRLKAASRFSVEKAYILHLINVVQYSASVNGAHFISYAYLIKEGNHILKTVGGKPFFVLVLVLVTRGRLGS